VGQGLEQGPVGVLAAVVALGGTELLRQAPGRGLLALGRDRLLPRLAVLLPDLRQPLPQLAHQPAVHLPGQG
jgi:hypothetical protein